MNTFARYTRRLLFWFERPLPSEEWMNAFKFGEVSGRNKVLKELKELGLLTQIQQQKLLPITIRQRVAMRTLRATLPPAMPIQSAAIPSVQHTELVDEDWLNSMPLVAVMEEQEEEEDITNKVPVISKLKWENKQ